MQKTKGYSENTPVLYDWWFDCKIVVAKLE